MELLMLNAAEATAATQAIPFPSAAQFPNREERAIAVQEYCTAQDAVTEEFRAYLEHAYSRNHIPEERPSIWSAAWSNGHASGYSEVESLYHEYSDLTDEELEELDY